MRLVFLVLHYNCLIYFNLKFYSIKKSEQIALNALDDLQKQNTYIEQTAFKVAPDYLELAYQHESKYNYELADKALEPR